ncbi:GNAT family N-acetyltransferase [Nocardioides aurantiacus]|uniref:Acetyltransferase (GNAT) family protein n=1 Tax=Nocardioides aurantiacus TaxID=86796 RepID=A0A3N2CXQ4_9ACTN|nr:GNAT family N-acetyltransferase [Nocardioides aurantiacus]ROR92266.1 acetyltransferase (GNAT) family protein [Nocardioides aurantiacus]
MVGTRVVVRRLVRGETGPSGGPAMTDVLGECVAWADGVVAVRRENGDVVRIPLADLVAGKPVPPRPSVHHRLDPGRADRLAAPGWPAAEQERLDDWLLRASGGFSSRANSVLAVGDPDRPLDDAVAHVEEWYAARSLRPRAHVLPGSAQMHAFEDAAWAPYETTSLMLASLSRVVRRLEAPDVVVTEHRHLDDGWLATDERAARFGGAARAVMEAGEVTLATVRDEEGRVLARGRGTVHGDWCGVSGLWTREDRRGQGLSRAVLAALLERGAEAGATTAYLQVVESNETARGLYETLGWAEHHQYVYLAAP